MPGSLYDYWRPLLTDPLIGTVRGAGGVLVNLASLDVLGALDMDRIRGQVRVVTPEFQERRDGRFETVRTYAKMARGEMTRYILQQRIETPEALKGSNGKDFVSMRPPRGPNAIFLHAIPGTDPVPGPDRSVNSFYAEPADISSDGIVRVSVSYSEV